MKTATRILIIVLAVATLVSCKKEPVMDAEFMQRDSFGLQIDGLAPFSMIEQNCQVAFNRARKQFRIGTDNMSNYYVLTTSSLPSKEGQNIDGCTLTWTQDSSVKILNGLTFKVDKMENDGRVWLWCSKKKIAVIVQLL